MKLQISHLTKYSYQEPVVDSVNEIRLSPRTDSRQLCSTNSIVIEPNVSLFSYEDYFGNTVHYFNVVSPHKELVIESQSIVETSEIHQKQASQVSYNIERQILESEQFQNKYAEYLMETNYTGITPQLKAFCKEAIDPTKAESVYQLLEQISASIYSNFTYDVDATHVQTTVEEMLRLKRGVCQDYVHLMIAVCRLYHIPARYVSGYQFIGDLNNSDETEVQHASHAWLEAYVPLVGWVGLDPTNNGKIDCRYVKIGHGRNYGDIVPIKGIYRGGEKQDLEVTVDVKKVND
ncbi:transglutaminase family protein [Bacillus taeanensis]|uniref:Transglutaminase family protein n=1 Tax=Bacillus taeanensis TaxID=273032 RepID=A0A366XZR3_9BACI|nr:transglutaminase family protein [Bacillus taeanensis]RBW69654.1 transglutaminase family protein [Bacillus taeanensis]